MNLLLLLATFAALLCGPLLYALVQRRPHIVRWLDRFVLVSVVGLIGIEVLPETWKETGVLGLGMIALGLIGPNVVEQLLSRARRETHIAVLVLALLGLLLHSFGDGTALSPAQGQGHLGLAVAVAVHSIPVGLLVWWLLFPVFGPALPALALATMCGATLAGYALGQSASDWLSPQHWSLLQALVAGSILHVAFGRRHSHVHHAHD